MNRTIAYYHAAGREAQTAAGTVNWPHGMSESCTHLDQIKIEHTSKKSCEECVKMGDTWVHLRLCLSCGHVGCCDSSKNKHATKHFHATKHPLMRSIEPGESWIWCFVDKLMPGEIDG